MASSKSSKTSNSEANIVSYKDKDGAVHWASRTAPAVVKGLESGDFTLLEEVAPDAPAVSKTSVATDTRASGNGS